MTHPRPRPTLRTFLLGSFCGAAAFTALLAGGITADDGPPGEAPGLAGLGPGLALAGPAASSVGTQFSDVAESVLPSVVWIDTTTIMSMPNGPMFGFPDFFGRSFGESRPRGEQREFSQRGLGSGVVISGDGYIVTNHHVAGTADQLRVTLSDGRKFDAELVGTDPATDLAVIKLVGDVSDLPALTLGDSEALRLGEVVMAIGNPFGLSGSVSLGIVSAKERTSVGINRYENFIQTDAAINRGNSGGALVNMRGELIGINTMIYSPNMGFGQGGNVGIGFAIPSDQARPIIKSLIAKGTVDRGWLGVHIQDLSPDMTAGFSVAPDTRGVIVAKVTDDSPAAKAGMKDADIIVSVDGTPTEDTNDLRNAIAAAGPGHKARIEVFRDGKRKRVTVKLGEAPGAPTRRLAVLEDEREAGAVEIDGLHLGDLPTYRSRVRVASDIRSGVVVLSVEPGTAAADSELKPGDIIVEVNRAPVRSIAEFEQAVRATKGPPLLLVRRAGATIYMVLDD
jgi:serine protease Do